MPKQARINRIKAFRCYTIHEAAEVSGVSPRTISNWVKSGLRIMHDKRPALLRGDDLIKFIKDQRKQRKHPLMLDRFYCVRCRAPRKAAGDLAECQDTGKRLTLIAMCEVCETILRKPLARADLPKLRELLDVGLDVGVP
tara:strand:- start:13 stop:432 length:420 start_codon:yes stop_codon:yes gene_type:complete